MLEGASVHWMYMDTKLLNGSSSSGLCAYNCSEEEFSSGTQSCVVSVEKQLCALRGARKMLFWSLFWIWNNISLNFLQTAAFTLWRRAAQCVRRWGDGGEENWRAVWKCVWVIADMNCSFLWSLASMISANYVWGIHPGTHVFSTFSCLY